MKVEQLTKAYTIERLNTANLCDVEKLHTVVYGRTPDPGFFFKKYDTYFTGVEHIGHIAYNAEHTAIGYYGVIPCFLKIGDRVVLAAQSADTMTHPRYRYKGLFVELANLTFQLCRDNGIELLFGFPNQNSLPGFINKLGWKTTETMDVFVINLLFPWQKLVNKFSFTRVIYKDYLKKQIERNIVPQNGFASSVLGDGFSGICRDEDYIKYKSYSNTYTIKLGPATLWIKISQVLLVGDILVESEDFNRTIHQLKLLAGKLGLKQIHFHTSPGTTLHQLFSAHFIPVPSFPVLFKELSGNLPLHELKFTSADIDTF
jgi:GNAT superfamily N-acetyltransferase